MENESSAGRKAAFAGENVFNSQPEGRGGTLREGYEVDSWGARWLGGREGERSY